MKNFIKSICFILIATMASTQMYAQDAPNKPMKQEAKFTSDMLEWILFQVKLLDLARTQAHGTELRQFGGKMLPQYLMMGYNIGSYADAHGFTVDPEDNEAFSDVDEKIIKYMEKGKTLEWNSDVAETLRDENKDGIDMLQDYGKGEIKDPELEKIRVSFLATLESHNAMMDELKSKMKKPWKEENRPNPDMKSGKR